MRSFAERYSFDWEVLDVLMGGQSSIDQSRGLRLRTAEDAAKFMDCYGYDPENPIEKAELLGNFREALSFIKRYFLQPENPEGLKLDIPRKVSEINDVQHLLLLASQITDTPDNPTNQSNFAPLWACSILKIMHTIAHIDKDLRTHYFPEIQKQILDRFYKHIHSDDKNTVYLGRDVRDSDRVDLVLFDSKPKKSRDSVILKLLHKPENVAEDIFDRVGIRFVTKNKYDCLRVVKFLRDRYVIMPANLKPSRSRNTLLDTSEFTVELKKLLDASDSLTTGDIDQKLIQYCESLGAKLKKSGENPHTSEFYQSIHFTGRQLIKFRNQVADDLKALKQAAQGGAVPEKLSRVLDRLDLGSVPREIRFFYPFEVQIFDETSFRESEAGLSSHSNYKKSQVRAAMHRVMNSLIPFSQTRP